MLIVVYMTSYLDRQILSILLPQIKAEFKVSDTYLGLLTGFAFAVFYTTLGIPLARMADRGSRVNLLAICIASWSLMTALCGTALTFVQLTLARIGVGVGEAGCNPSAHSLIADYFPFEKRAFALSAYATGVPLGSLLGLALGGWLGETYGWRVAFIAVGLPGLLLAVVVKMVLKEPARGKVDGIRDEDAPGMLQTFRYLWRAKSFRGLCAASAADAFVGYGLLLWLPTYLIRSFGLGPSEIGLRLGIMFGIAGVIGALGAGLLTDRLGKRDRRFYCLMPMIVYGIALVGNVLVYTSQSVSATFALLIVPLIVLPAGGGPLYAATQAIAPVRMRATAAALLLLTTNLIGLGLGPAFVGLASDLLAPEYGDSSLRYAMLIISSSYIVAMLMAYVASRFFITDLKKVDAGYNPG